MSVATQYENFVQKLIACQDMLYAYILSLVPKADAADEVLQETNLVLCRKMDESAKVVDFDAWARRIAHFQVLALLKRRQRDRHVFDEDLVGLLATEADTITTDAIDQRRHALRTCLARLAEPSRQMILKRYAPGNSVAAIAEELGRPTGSVYQALYRIRTTLMNCVKRALGREQAAEC